MAINNSINSQQKLDPTQTPSFVGLNLTGTPSSYTPTIGDGTNNFTTSTAIGKYWKLGHLYLCSIQIIWTSKGSASAGSGITINLPATIGSNDPRICPSIGYSSGISYTGSTLIGAGSSGNANFNLWGISSLGIVTAVTVSQCSTNGEFQANFIFWDN